MVEWREHVVHPGNGSLPYTVRGGNYEATGIPDMVARLKNRAELGEVSHLYVDDQEIDLYK